MFLAKPWTIILNQSMYIGAVGSNVVSKIYWCTTRMFSRIVSIVMSSFCFSLYYNFHIWHISVLLLIHYNSTNPAADRLAVLQL